jgi:hypothetical protein
MRGMNNHTCVRLLCNVKLVCRLDLVFNMMFEGV